MNSKTIASPGSRVTAGLRTALLVFLIFFPLTFVHLFVHEGGHALVSLYARVPHTSIYFHPFSFSGFSRPMYDYHNAWGHLGGPLISLLAALILFILFWKRRSFNHLLFVAFVAWTVFWEGTGFMDILGGTGDFFNVARVTNLPVGLFFGIDLLLFISGIVLFVSLLPLFGLKADDLNGLWALPLGMGLYGVLGLVLASILAPISPFAIRYDLVREIQLSAGFRPLLMTAAGLLFAGLYVTLYRAIRKKLPAFLRTECRPLEWRDLRVPAILAVLSIAAGLVIIL